ncbi:MAG: DUF4417 domain-containing protein [Selenomonadaceae bacterium]|nr:DUF4417 domain-containing protein [Selenomonadaceae bacterium]
MPTKVRAGCKDNWNAFMVKGAEFTKNDIPSCPTTATQIPNKIISYSAAKTLCNKFKHYKNFSVDAFVHFYIDDYKFDSNNGIWANWRGALKILKHFAGIITPDFSTNSDFPEPLKIWNTCRMRTFGYWYGVLQGGAVINNVRWGKKETFKYCFDGIPKNSIVAIGTVASGLKSLKNRELFTVGFEKMLKVLKPKTILVYGSDNYECFDKVRNKIEIVHFQSAKDLALRGEVNE